MIRLPQQWYARAFSQTLASFARTHLLRTGFQLGLFESLREPQTAHRLSQDSGLAPDLLQAWLRAAEAQGLVTRVQERNHAFQVSGLARWLLEAPESGSLLALLDQTTESYGPIFERMPGLLRGVARPEFGRAAEARRAAEVSRLVEGRAIDALARIPGARAAKRILDIGCGYGTYLTGLLRRYRDVHGVGIEQDADVAEIARRNLRAADLTRRVEIRVGEFMSVDLDPGAFDLILLNNNLYYFAPNDRPALFERVLSCLVPRGVFAIQVPVISDHPAARFAGQTATIAAFDLYLRAHSNLYGIPEPTEIHAALRGAGFSTIGETAFLLGGSARYVWGRAPR